MAVYINSDGEEVTVGQSEGRAALEALGWTLLRGDAHSESAAPAFALVPTLIEVDHEAEEIRIDGERLPYVIGDNPLVHTIADDVQSVWVQLLADRVSVIGETRHAVLNDRPSGLTPPVQSSADVPPVTDAVIERKDTASAPWVGDLDAEARKVADAEKVEPEKAEPDTETAVVDVAADADVAVAEPKAVEPAPEPKRTSRTRRAAAKS